MASNLIMAILKSCCCLSCFASLPNKLFCLAHTAKSADTGNWMLSVVFENWLNVSSHKSHRIRYDHQTWTELFKNSSVVLGTKKQRNPNQKAQDGPKIWWFRTQLSLWPDHRFDLNFMFRIFTFTLLPVKTFYYNLAS